MSDKEIELPAFSLKNIKDKDPVKLQRNMLIGVVIILMIALFMVGNSHASVNEDNKALGDSLNNTLVSFSSCQYSLINCQEKLNKNCEVGNDG